MRRGAVLALAVLLSVPAQAADPIRIGLMAPLTGSWASEGQEMKRAVELLAASLNAKGGLLGRKVEALVEDDGADPRTAALAAQRLASAKAVAVVGTYGSSQTEAAQAILDEAGIVQVANASTATRLTGKGLSLFFRTCPRDDQQGRYTAGVLVKLGAKRIALVHDNTSYAKGLAESTKAGLAALGVTPVAFEAVTPGERDTTAVLTKLKAARPDVVYFSGYYPEGGLLLRQRREMGWNVPFVGGDGNNNVDLVKVAGKAAAEGFLCMSPPLPQDLDTPEAKAYLADYKARYGALPQSIWGVLAGDAFRVIARAIEVSGSTEGKKVAAALKGAVKEFPGLTGKISFDAHGDRVGDVYTVYRVDAQGAFHPRK